MSQFIRILVSLLTRGVGRRLSAIVVLAALLCIVPQNQFFPGIASSAALAQTTTGVVVSLDDALARWPQLSEKQRLAILEQLIKAGQFDRAEQLLSKFQARSATNRLHARYLFGALRKAQGHVKEAIDIFRELLDDNPQFQRVRLELAHALFLAQEDTSARHHFDLVLGSTTNTALQNAVHSYIDAMDKRKRWNVSGYFSLAPSTNINQGAAARTVNFNGLTFTIDEASRQQSGVGVNAGVTGGYRQPITDKLDLVVGGGAHVKRYKESLFNDTIVSAEVGPRYRFQKGDVALYGTATRRWHGGDDYGWFYGGRIHSAFRLGPKDILRAGGFCQKKKHASLAYQDGWGCTASVSEDHFLGASSFMRVLGGYSLDRNQVKHLDYTGFNVGAGYYTELPFALTVYSQAKYTARQYDGIYPTASEARKDDRLDMTLHLTKRDWEIFALAPMLQYTYTLNKSNIGFHDYDAHGVNLTWTKKF